MKYCHLSSTWLFMICLLCGFFARGQYDTSWNREVIRPGSDHPFYWQYKGKPLLLAGASDNDNLFQSDFFETHLDSLADIGGNYIRCTMSDRDPGDVRAFARTPDGKYDLDKWNPEYWDRFERLLSVAQKHDIIVQIEVWDRFDHSRSEWLKDPYHPANNINYSYEDSGLDSLYPNHPGSNEQPFFYTVPELEDNPLLLSYQQAFVDQLLSISLNYDNILYCIDNETNGAEEWGAYWADYIHHTAEGKYVAVTEMWDDWDVRHDRHQRTIGHPERYDFVDLSQNSQLTGPAVWANPRMVFEQLASAPRPVNSVKIYGNSDYPSYAYQGKDSDHAVHTFFKNMMGGFAASRFHRPPAGLGLSERSIAAIKTLRALESRVDLWDIRPRMEWLSDTEPDEAFLAAGPQGVYVIYFPAGGSVMLDLSRSKGKMLQEWLSVDKVAFGQSSFITGGQSKRFSPPGDQGWFLILRPVK